MTVSLERRAALALRVCQVCYGALLLLFLCKTLLWPMGGRNPNLVMWAIHTVPLLPFLPGLWRGDARTCAWLAFAILLYFMQTVLALFSPDPSAYHWLALVLIVALFTAVTLYIRWQGQCRQRQSDVNES